MLMRSQRLAKLWYFGNRSRHINHGVISQGSSKYHSKTLEGPESPHAVLGYWPNPSCLKGRRLHPESP